MKLWTTAENGFSKTFRGYRINFTLRNALRAVALSSDGTISENIKVRETLRLLLKRGSYLRALLSGSKDRKSLALGLLDELGGEKRKGGPRVIDFDSDAELIYAAFLGAYRIDILKERLDYRAFIALISSLPENTRLYEIMRIRAADVPPENKLNGDYVRNLRALKSAFSLESDNFQAGLTKLFTRMTAREHGKEKNVGRKNSL